MADRIYIPVKKAPTPILKPRGARLWRRYNPDQTQPETASLADEGQLSTLDQSNLESSTLASPPRGHSFGRMTVWPAASPRMQPKPALGEPNDAYEQEADRVADQVMRMAEPRVQAKCACGGEAGPDGECAACKAQRLGLQRHAQGEPAQREEVVQAQSDSAPAVAAPDLESRLNDSRGSGQALPSDTRGAMESAFGVDFSGVRVHTGSEAVQMNRELSAQAFTHGSDIYFNAGKYEPSSAEGDKLLAHELTHVVQQRSGRVNASTQAAGLPVNDEAGLELEADEMGRKVLQNRVQKKEHQEGCNCPECSGQISRSEALGSIQGKGHDKGCRCAGCLGSGSRMEVSPDARALPLQKKQINHSVIQMKPEGVISHTFLGIGVGGGVHRDLRDRLNLVQAELQKQYDALPAAGKPATLKEYAEVNTISGYQDRKGNHGTGKAVDVNYRNQPYIPTRTTEGGTTTYGGEEGKATAATKALRKPAVEVYDRAVSFVNVQGESADVSNRKEGESATDAYRRFRATSDALATYFSLAFHSNYDEVTRQPILNPEAATEAELLLIPTTERKVEATAIADISSFMGGWVWQILHPNYPLTPREQYFRILRDYETVRKPMQRGNPSTQPGDTRNPAKGFLHLPEHFVVAMMDVGKLRWGACEFSASSNGDVHHFDLTTPHRTPALKSGLGSAPAKVLWKVDKSSSPPSVIQLGTIDSVLAHFANFLPNGIYEMYAHPVVASGDTYLKVYTKDGSFQYWPTNEYNLIEMPDNLGQKGGKNVLGGSITNYSPDDVETSEGDRFLLPQAAAALINTMGRFHLSARNAELGMGDASTRTGDSPRIEAGKTKRHATHYGGNAFDARYLNAQGQSEQIGSGTFDTNANYDFIKTAVDEGYRFVIIGDKKTFDDLYAKLKELKSLYNGLKLLRESHHNDHMHLAFKPSVAKGKNKKVTKTHAMETEWAPILELIGVDPDDIFVPSDPRVDTENAIATGVQAKFEDPFHAIQRKPENEKPLSQIQGLAMYDLLPELGKLPTAVRSDQEAGKLVGGSRLLLAMNAVSYKEQGKTFSDFSTEQRLELIALRYEDQIGDVLRFLGASPKDIANFLKTHVQSISTGWAGVKTGANTKETVVGDKGQQAGSQEAGIRRVPVQINSKQQVIVLIPSGLAPGADIDVLLHLHGHNAGYTGTSLDDVRDVQKDQIEQQLLASGQKQRIAILPQGSNTSRFTGVDTTAYVGSVFAALNYLGAWGKDEHGNFMSVNPHGHSIILSAHSGGGDLLSSLLEEKGKPANPGGLKGLFWFDSINASSIKKPDGTKSGVPDVNNSTELRRVRAFVKFQIDLELTQLGQLSKLPNGTPDPDQTQVSKRQRDYLEGKGFRVRGYYTGGWYAQIHAPLVKDLVDWFKDAHGLDPQVLDRWKANYVVQPVSGMAIGKGHQGHDYILGQGKPAGKGGKDYDPAKVGALQDALNSM